MIYHITTQSEWLSAQQTGAYTAPSLEAEGFIHCSHAHQIVGTANFLFKGQNDLILLAIDPEKLDVPLVDEDLYDWIVGITLNHSFNHAWSGVLQMDMGLDGDNDSNQFLNGFLSYEFDNSHALWFGYRYLKIGNKFREDGSRVETEFIQSGPTLGWAWNF